MQAHWFAASSRPCSECGYKNDDLRLSDRRWKCPCCNTQQVRDLNAAVNLKSEGLRMLAAGCAERQKAHGPRVRLAEASSVGGSGNGGNRKAAKPPSIGKCFAIFFCPGAISGYCLQWWHTLGSASARPFHLGLGHAGAGLGSQASTDVYDLSFYLCLALSIVRRILNFILRPTRRGHDCQHT